MATLFPSDNVAFHAILSQTQPPSPEIIVRAGSKQCKDRVQLTPLMENSLTSVCPEMCPRVYILYFSNVLCVVCSFYVSYSSVVFPLVFVWCDLYITSCFVLKYSVFPNKVSSLLQSIRLTTPLIKQN